MGVSEHILLRHRAEGVFVHTPGSAILNSPDPVLIPQRTVNSLGTIGFMGRLEPAKGLPVLIKALHSLPHLDVKLVVAGSGRAPDEAAIIDAIRRDSRITWLGRVTPQELLVQSDAIMVPTQWDEPFGRVAAEARSCNVPVVASDVGGLREALSGFGRSRFVASFEDPSAWAATIAGLAAEWQPTLVGGPGRLPRGDAVHTYANLFYDLLSRGAGALTPP